MLIICIALSTLGVLSALFYKKCRRPLMLAGVGLFTVLFSCPVYGVQNDAYSYTITIEDLQKSETQEQIPYGEVKTGDANQQLPLLSILILIGVIGLLNRIYVNRQEDKYGGENGNTQ